MSFPQLALRDPVHTVSLQQFVYEKLKAQQELLGEQGFQALMETVDTEIVAQLQEFLQGFWIREMSLVFGFFFISNFPLKRLWKNFVLS